MTRHRLHTLGLDASQKLAAADWLQLVYGGNLLFDAVDSTSVGSKNRRERRRIPGGSALPLGWLTLTPMARYDLYSDFPASLTYKLAAVVAVSDSVSLKASACALLPGPDAERPVLAQRRVHWCPPAPYTYTSIHGQSESASGERVSPATWDCLS